MVDEKLGQVPPHLWDQYNDRLEFQYALLQELEQRSKILLDSGERGPRERTDHGKVQRLLAGLCSESLRGRKVGIDFDLELRLREGLVSELRFPAIFRYLVAIPGDQGWGVERENHKFGYHIHYVRVKGKQERRTDALFVFNPTEPPVTTPPILYWEHHHEDAHVRVSPADFGQRRRQAIYDVCESFLASVQKKDFRRLSKKSARFHP